MAAGGGGASGCASPPPPPEANVVESRLAEIRTHSTAGLAGERWLRDVSRLGIHPGTSFPHRKDWKRGQMGGRGNGGEMRKTGGGGVRENGAKREKTGGRGGGGNERAPGGNLAGMAGRVCWRGDPVQLTDHFLPNAQSPTSSPPPPDRCHHHTVDACLGLHACMSS